MTAMPLLHTVASGLISRRAARRIGRVIPNPVLRYAVVTAATALVPILIAKASDQWKARRGAGARRRRLHA